MVTLKDIAKMCNVSPSTVSNVLNGKSSMGEQVRERVLAAVRETGYRPNYYARSMRVNKTNTIGIIVEDLCQFSSPNVVEMVLEYLEQHGYRYILMNLRMYYKLKNNIEDEEALCEILEPVIQQMESIKIDGIVYVAAHCRMLKKVPKLFSLPTVFTYAYANSKDMKSVIIDDENSAITMMDYLLSKGHHEIGIIAGTEDNYHTKERLKGCQRSMYKAGILYNPDRICFGDWSRESGYEKAKILLKKGVTALWCMNDRMASGAYMAIREKGLEVGKDVSVTGFDNIELASNIYPTLTTCQLPLYAIGYKAAQLIVSILEKEEGDDQAKDGSTIRLKSELVERDSVAELTR